MTNTNMLWAIPVALALAVVLALVGWVLLRPRPRPGQRTATPPPERAEAAPAPLPATDAGGGVAAQHQAATEALRQARRRKAEDDARLAAGRATAPAAAPPPHAPPPHVRPPQAQPPHARPAPSVASRPEPVVPVLSPLAIQLNTGRAPVLSAPAAPAGLAPLRTPPRPPRTPTVLVADDSKVVRVKTGRLFEKLGWRVLLAEDGQAALRCLDLESPDLLITDVEMPGLDGFALTRHLRGQARWARLPVIMITSSDDKHRTEALAAGVNVLLGKPYAEDMLIAKAQALLGTRAPAEPALH